MKIKHLLAAAVIGTLMAHPALAQSAGNPLAGATDGAAEFRDALAQFGLVVGGIGMVACLMLGFFGKLNWKWVATGIGVSFAMATVPGAITWLASLSGA